MNSRDKQAKLADILEVYFKMGGMHVQFNVLNQEDLLEAQNHPDDYQDLVVRVSGYSAYFIDLGKPVQDDIIERLQFNHL